MTNLPVLQSLITCPVCGFAKEEKLATANCQFFYTYTNCQTRLRPKAGDCCVFCSYGTNPCPSTQSEINGLEITVK